MAKAQASTPPPPPEYDFSKDAGAGFENVKSGDLSIPFLVILQDGSPEVKKTHKDYATKGIKGAQAGMILNTVTKELYVTEPGELGKEPGPDGCFEFIPCMYQKLYVEWKSRDSGGGIVESHSDDALLLKCKKNEKGQDVLPNGNVLQTTAYFFGVALIKGEPVRCVIGLSSTQLKKARQWLNISTAIKLTGPDGSKFTPPLFSHRYRLSSIPESNDKGSWYGWAIKLAGRVSDPVLIEDARTVHTQSKSGQMKMLAAPEPEGDITPIAPPDDGNPFGG